MIFIGKAPYRISLLGGGSDIEWFLEEEGYGYALGYSLNQFSYSVLKVLPKSANEGTLKYSSLERYSSTEEIVHPYIRETLKMLKITPFLEISTFGFASGGAGIGGSSSFLLSLIAALNRCFNKKLSKYEQAELASIIEIDRLSKPIGRQDQFLSCYGSISVLKFEKNGKVTKQKITSAKEKVIDKVIENLYLIPSFITRKTDSVLRNLKNDPLSIDQFLEIRKISENFIKLEEDREHVLEEKFHLSVKESWEIKKTMSKVMNKDLNERFDFINQAVPNNWIRLLGAGSGGYFLVSIKSEISNPEELLISKGIFDFLKATKSQEGISSHEV